MPLSLPKAAEIQDDTTNILKQFFERCGSKAAITMKELSLQAMASYLYQYTIHTLLIRAQHCFLRAQITQDISKCNGFMYLPLKCTQCSPGYGSFKVFNDL